MYKVQVARVKVKNLFVCCLSLLTKDRARYWRRCAQVIKTQRGSEASRAEIAKEPASGVPPVAKSVFWLIADGQNPIFSGRLVTERAGLQRD